MSLRAAPGQISVYVKIDERSGEIIDRIELHTTAYPRPAEYALSHFRCKEGEAVYTRVGGKNA